MGCSAPSFQKWTTYSLSILFITLGILTVFLWRSLFQSILNHELSLSNRRTFGYTMWRETPIPMYIEFYLWNLTNSEEFENGWNNEVIPKFEECGPYTYHEHHIRKAVVFNDNNTITYNTTRIWKFLPDKTRGSMEDVISNINPIILSMAKIVKPKHYIVQRGVHYFIKEKQEPFVIRRTAREFLFDGFEDPLLDLVHSLNMTVHIPFTKFAWFVDRNQSADYDGITNMNTGSDDIHKLGRINTWNYDSQVPFYNGTCGRVDGTSGELWYPTKDQEIIGMFAPDVCSIVELSYEKPFELHGIAGRKYVGTDRVFDNGTKYPEMACFIAEGEQLNSGVRDVSSCKYDAPAFVSYPHYYLADPSYSEGIAGMRPDKNLHEFYIALEPSTGLPLKVAAAFQVNLKAEALEGIDYLKNMNSTVYVPMLWFRETAELSTSLANEAKLMLVLPAVGHYTGFGIIGIGGVLLVLAALMTFGKIWIFNS